MNYHSYCWNDPNWYVDPFLAGTYPSTQTVIVRDRGPTHFSNPTSAAYLTAQGVENQGTYFQLHGKFIDLNDPLC